MSCYVTAEAEAAARPARDIDNNIQAARPRFAVVVTLANNSTHAQPARALEALDAQLCRLRGVVGSLRACGYAGEIVCQIAGWRQTPRAAAALRQSCTRVCRVRVPRYDAGVAAHDTNNTIAYYQSHQRVPPPSSSEVQQRTDGALTAVKFHAWRLVQYDVIVHSDIDVLFLESPEAALRVAYERSLIFQAASSETAKRSYRGMNTHMV